MKKISWIITIIGAVLGLIILILAWNVESAPQQAAGAALAMAFAVIPYCFARAVSEINAHSHKDDPLNNSEQKH